MSYFLEHIIAFSVSLVSLWLLLLVIYLTFKRYMWRKKRAQDQPTEVVAETDMYGSDLANDPIIQHIISIKKGKVNE